MGLTCIEVVRQGSRQVIFIFDMTVLPTREEIGASDFLEAEREMVAGGESSKAQANSPIKGVTLILFIYFF